MSMLKWLITGMISMMAMALIHGQEGIVCKVEINPDTILMENYFVVQFTLENAKGRFEAPEFNDFEIVSGPNKSSSISVINGETSRTVAYSYYLRPREAGIFYIDPVRFYLDDDSVIETEPLEIEVHPNPEGRIIEPRSPNSMPGLSRDWFFGWPEQERARQIRKPAKKKRKVYKF